MLAGRVSTGGVVSSMVTVNVPGSEALRDASVAVQLTVVAPRANAPPLAGKQTTVGDGSTASVAVAV